MKRKISLGYIALGVLCIFGGRDSYLSEWDFKYQQPGSKIGAIALICFGIAIICVELLKYFKKDS